MDELILLSAPPTEPSVQETYAAPAVVFEASLEVRAGTVSSPPSDPLNLFGTGEN
jgi:hypothetical protein